MNKSIIGLAIASIYLSTLMMPVLAAPTLNPNKIYGAPSYVLNLIGKKEGWSGGGVYDNPDRHTMFVPETSVHGTGTYDGTSIQTNTTMWITQGSEFGVLDGSAFDDDGDVNLQLGSGKYYVFVVALGKPGGSATIKGWIYNDTSGEYLLPTGIVTVPGHSKTPRWVNATDLLFVSSGEDPYGLVSGDTWIFDYLAKLEAYAPVGDYLYLWDLDMNACKHLQIRFYQIA